PQATTAGASGYDSSSSIVLPTPWRTNAAARRAAAAASERPSADGVARASSSRLWRVRFISRAVWRRSRSLAASSDSAVASSSRRSTSPSTPNSGWATSAARSPSAAPRASPTSSRSASRRGPSGRPRIVDKRNGADSGTNESMTEATTCVVADDHPAMLTAVADILARSGFDVVGRARDGDRLLHRVRRPRASRRGARRRRARLRPQGGAARRPGAGGRARRRRRHVRRPGARRRARQRSSLRPRARADPARARDAAPARGRPVERGDREAAAHLARDGADAHPEGDGEARGGHAHAGRCDGAPPVHHLLMELRRRDLDADPLRQFERWYADASRATAVPERMALATAAADGAPSLRMVLLKGFDERGLRFFTHTTSRKGRELGENPRAAVLLYWGELGRQVRVEGAVASVEEAESDAYFAS